MRHNDDRRIEDMLERARRWCNQRGAHLTEHRARILKLLMRQRRPLTAYALLSLLEKLRHRTVSPVTIYRALEFLVRQGLVARLARRNAYLACEHVGHAHAHLVFICTGCAMPYECADRTTERRVAEAARQIGFVPSPMTIEIDGLRDDCRAARTHSAQPCADRPSTA